MKYSILFIMALISAHPIEFDVQFTDENGDIMPEKHIAAVTEHGVVIPGYRKEGEEYKKI